MAKTFDRATSEQNILSIRLSTDGFCFFVFNPLKQGFPCEDYAVDEALSMTANLKQAYQRLEWLGQAFNRINVLVSDKRFTFMPLELFEEDLAETVFYHNHPKQDNEVVLYNIRSHNNLVILFSMDKSTYLFLKEKHPGAHFYAQASPLADCFARESRLGSNRKMYAHLRKDAMDVFCFERGHLLLGNSYLCNVTPDRMYYLLYVWKTLDFDQERDELYFTGLLDEKEQLLDELHTYIRQVFIMNPSTDIDLQTITACE